VAGPVSTLLVANIEDTVPIPVSGQESALTIKVSSITALTVSLPQGGNPELRLAKKSKASVAGWEDPRMISKK
jgi:hypothetical protein